MYKREERRCEFLSVRYIAYKALQVGTDEQVCVRQMTQGT